MAIVAVQQSSGR